MHRIACFSLFLTIYFVFQFGCGMSLSVAAEKPMKVTSSGIKDGVIDEQYGARGSQKKGEIPTLSMPLSIENAPASTICYAIQMLDPDSVPNEWVHWLAVNVETPDLPENASIDMASDMIQGKNSFGSIGYGGPTPPDKPHTYVIAIYALDAKMNLRNNFTNGQFIKAIKGHVLAEKRIRAKYNK